MSTALVVCTRKTFINILPILELFYTLMNCLHFSSVLIAGLILLLPINPTLLLTTVLFRHNLKTVLYNVY